MVTTQKRIKKFTTGNIIILIMLIFIARPIFFGDIKISKLDEEINIDGAVVKLKQANFYKYKNNPENLGELTLTGYLIIKDRNRYPTYDLFRDQISIFTSVKEGTSTSFNYSYYHSDTFKLMECKIKVPHDTNGFKIFVANNRDDSKKELSLPAFWNNILPSWPEVEKTLLIRQYTISTENSVEPHGSLNDIIRYLEYFNLPKLKHYIMPGSKAETNWALLQHTHWDKDKDFTINYVGEYQNYQNVYLLHWQFGKRDDKYHLVPSMEQEVYLVLKEDDEFRVIDVKEATLFNV